MVAEADKTKNRPRTGETGRKREAASQVDAPKNPLEFYASMVETLDALTEAPDVLLNIPIWGWQYSGKTCALLTAVHYLAPELHGVGLARVKDHEELAALESTHPGYAGLGLGALAEATAARLAELNQMFFVDLEWPPGTDLPMHYLLEVRARSGRAGFVLFPDIMGGSYEKLDQTAKNAIAGAHAFILLVDAREYQGTTPEAKEYRDDILGIIQRCARSRIPTCIMLTKDDEHQADPKAADETLTTLTALLDGQRSGFIHKVLRVSVTGDVSGDWSKSPPSAEQRKPESLLEGWVWTLYQALSRPREDVLRQVPRVNLRETAGAQTPLTAAKVAELRIVRDQTDAPGRVVCPVIGEGADARFLLLDENDGQLTEVAISRSSAEVTIGRTVQVESWEQLDALRVHTTAGAVFLGSEAADQIWHGAKGQSLKMTHLPLSLRSWLPVGDRSITGVGENGTLHLLRLNNGKWESSDYQVGFVESSGNIGCGFIRAQNLLVVHTGTAVAAIEVSEKAGLGAKSAVKLAVRYDTPDVMVNEQGIVVARRSDNMLIAGREQAHDLGALDPAFSPSFAVALNAGAVAWVSAEQKLHAALLQSGSLRATAAAHSPDLDESPDGICWDVAGTVLVLTFPSGRWSWAKCFGF